MPDNLLPDKENSKSSFTGHYDKKRGGRGLPAVYPAGLAPVQPKTENHWLVQMNEGKKPRSLPAVSVLQNKPVQKKELNDEELSVQLKRVVQRQTETDDPVLDPEEELPVQGKFEASEPVQQHEASVQKKPNNTGLPDNLKGGVENLSGYSLDDVKVHYNSDRPAQLQALAYAQGTDIHIGPGQERHLPHEAWHVVQQKQGRVQPTMQMKGGVPVNDDKGLEFEADAMALKAVQSAGVQNHGVQASSTKAPLSQHQFPFQLAKGDYDQEADNSGKIGSKQEEGLASIKLNKALHQKKWRKVNRLTGELYQRAEIITSLIPGILDRLWSLLEMLRDAPDVVEPQNVKSLDLMKLIEDGLEELTDQPLKWKEFDTLSMLGPLLHWLDEGINSAHPEKVNAHLKKLRNQQALREELSVVAHRGSGPTNRTRGGLIQQDDPRRLYRPAENSPEAFKAALSKTTKASEIGLDGVECDVFLSSDGLPVLSHEGAVQEQLNTTRKEVEMAILKTTHVEDLTKDQLVKIQRTGNAESNFMDLTSFLEMTASTAEAYYEVTQHPFRIEIEMKGKPHESENPERSSIKHPETYKEQLTETVAKAISKFKKAHPKLPVEIIIFNNSAVDSKAYGKLRGTKSRLGGLYTGLGSNDATVGKDSEVDELRMGASEANAELISHPAYKEFILTMVPGSELDINPASEKVNAFKPLVFTPGIDDLRALIVELTRRRTALQETVKVKTAMLERDKSRIGDEKTRIKKLKGELYVKLHPRAPKSKTGIITEAPPPSITEGEYLKQMTQLSE